MATLNEMIAQGAQFYTPDPTAQYNKMAQMQKYQQENELAKMQMEEYGRARQESNALRQFLPGLNESNRSQLLGFGAAGQGVYKVLGEGETQRRLAEQAKSQAAVNRSNEVKNAVAQTRNAVAGIDPNDAESYMTLRASVLNQYPELGPYMPDTWNGNVQQRLLVTADSVLERQKPNIAPIDVSKFTPESLQAYLNSKNPASLVAIAPKPVNPYAPIDPSKYTQDSLKAYNLSGQVSDLVPLPTKAANAFAPINVKDFTPESVKAFVASQNPADLVPLPTKATNPFAPINVKDYTPESLEAYGLSGKVSDLVPVPTKQKSNIANIDPSKFTVASVAKYDTSGNYADLEPIAAKPERPQNLVNPIDASKFTAPSVSAYSSSGGDYSLLVPVVSTTKADRTIANIDPSKYTSASVEKYSVSGNYGDLKLLPEKAGGGTADRAPSMTTIVDPTNPNQMLSIDARRYAGGGVGSVGVIGVSGKEPGAAIRQNKVEAGKTQLADDLENLRASFLTLDKMRAIPSTNRNPLSNIASATAATGIGQILGRATGTEAQVEREVINSARTRLVNSIKNATGMSAQQLNSNVELQTMLKSISDPGQPVQAALRIIEDIENAYVKGAEMPKKNAPGGGAPAAAAPASNITQQRQDANAAIAKGAPAAAVRQRFKQNTGQEL